MQPEDAATGGLAGLVVAGVVTLTSRLLGNNKNVKRETCKATHTALDQRLRRMETTVDRVEDKLDGLIEKHVR
jgi:hypothetical protein